MKTRSLVVAAVCATGLVGFAANAALGGEVTGSGKKEDQNQGMSWCSFSGANDDPGAPLDGPNGPGGHSQSFGQENRLGLADPHSFNPGVACNPNKTPLGPQPNRLRGL